jgi:hypothetical protein
MKKILISGSLIAVLALSSSAMAKSEPIPLQEVASEYVFTRLMASGEGFIVGHRVKKSVVARCFDFGGGEAPRYACKRWTLDGNEPVTLNKGTASYLFLLAQEHKFTTVTSDPAATGEGKSAREVQIAITCYGTFNSVGFQKASCVARDGFGLGDPGPNGF